MHHISVAAPPTHPMVTIAIDEHRGRTYAKAELRWGGAQLAGMGIAYRHPADAFTGDAGRKLATARALSDVADELRRFSRPRAGEPSP
ncbi:dsRBD fold-containing protein [Mycobacterium terramassiliense]|uniref:Uncharacterized protein n=1 Tax=Mycobacterium terramassiliense TaxID=1841859 RepID=A0A2U3NJ56_9MYCO|nr:dsRBD fold-containing protein [Mycobacterium terramassiliense]SPM31463.1 hypothetical protein BN971_01767 [Mycobacterium terramassiliense]